MGTSKIVMGVGVYTMIGLYALGFNTADQAVYTVAQNQAYHDQGRQIANIGVRFAIGDAGANSSALNLPSGTVSLIGGSVTYTSDRPAGMATTQMRVTSTSTYNSFQVTMVAVLEYNGVKWHLLKIYQQPSATEYTRLS